MDPLPLFVFGTLRRGECNHHLLEGSYEQMLPATLRGFARVHPLMIRRRDGGRVSGELYFIRGARYAETMRDCDDLEGIPPGETAGADYRRVRVSVETPRGSYEAWAYVHPDEGVGSRE